MGDPFVTSMPIITVVSMTGRELVGPIELHSNETMDHVARRVAMILGVPECRLTTQTGHTLAGLTTVVANGLQDGDIITAAVTQTDFGREAELVHGTPVTFSMDAEWGQRWIRYKVDRHGQHQYLFCFLCGSWASHRHFRGTRHVQRTHRYSDTWDESWIPDSWHGPTPSSIGSPIIPHRSEPEIVMEHRARLRDQLLPVFHVDLERNATLPNWGLTVYTTSHGLTVHSIAVGSPVDQWNQATSIVFPASCVIPGDVIVAVNSVVAPVIRRTLNGEAKAMCEELRSAIEVILTVSAGPDHTDPYCV